MVSPEYASSTEVEVEQWRTGAVGKRRDGAAEEVRVAL